MGREIRIGLVADAKLDGIREINREIAKMAMQVKSSSDDMRAAFARSARDFDPISSAADKAGGHVVLTAKQIADAWAKAMRKPQEEASKVSAEVQKSMDKAADEASKGANRMSGLLDGALKGIGGAFSQLGKMIMQGSVWGAMGAIATKAIGAVFDIFVDKVTKAAKRAEEAFRMAIGNIESYVQSCADAFDKSIGAIDRASRKYADATDSVRNLTKAQIELAKQMAIANGMSEKDAGMAAADLTKDMDDEAERKKLTDRIDANRKKRSEASEGYRRMNRIIRRAKEELVYAENNLSTVDHDDDEGYQKKLEIVEAARKALSDAKEKQGKYDRQIWDANEEIELARKAIETLETFREARAVEAQNRIAAEVDKRIAEEEKANEEAAQKEADARIAEEKRVAAERQKAEEKAAEKAAAERARLDAQEQVRRERERQAEFAARIKEHQKMLAEERAAESAAKAQQSAAESKLQQAWGWYRNKDSLRAQLEEEKADVAAQRQFEKDFEKLKFRRDWRTAKNLSLDDEATRRVALAREEKQAADEAVRETAENTRRAAEALEQVVRVYEGSEK